MTALKFFAVAESPPPKYLITFADFAPLREIFRQWPAQKRRHPSSWAKTPYLFFRTLPSLIFTVSQISWSMWVQY